jgi:3-mercaptopyruvate sulfurtransferase SseA
MAGCQRTAPSAYAAGHVPGAVNLPYRRITDDRRPTVAAGLLPPNGLLVTYCDGPHWAGRSRK